MNQHHHEHHDKFDLDLKIDSHGHASLTIKTENFQQLRGAIIALAEFLKQSGDTPATKLNLAAGPLERR